MQIPYPQLKIFLFIVLMVVFHSSCKKEDNSSLTGCCGNPGINEPVGNGHIYVPNIFTPNADGINDRLFISGDSIMIVKSLQIHNKSGVLVYEALDLAANDFVHSWDGTVNGIVEEGLYSINITVISENGVIQNSAGEVCNYPCEDLISGEEPITITNCHFPTQSDNGHFNSNIPPGEPSGCFEY